jgi:hypothetical protein
MKKAYQSPKMEIIELRTEQGVLTTSSFDGNPVPDAQEGDTTGWGIWN